MGIETVTLKTRKKENQSSKRKECCDTYCSHLIDIDHKTLPANSSLLASLAERLSLSHKDVIIERKFTSDKNHI